MMSPQLGCLACPCASECGSDRTAAGLAACPARRNLGFTIDASSVDMTDWKTLLLMALAAVLFYQLFLTPDKRTARASARRGKKKTAQIKAARERYEAEERRIRQTA